jgi:hypothetical protein
MLNANKHTYPMKITFTFLLSIFFQLAFSQENITLVDSISKEPVPNVYVYSINKELIGLTNKNGLIQLNGNSFPILIKSWGHQNKQYSQKNDTLLLSPKYQQIEEVTIMPIDYNKFYSELVKSSSKDILADTNTVINGTYFYSMIFIDLKKLDSIYILKKCDLSLVQNKNTKKIAYNYFPRNGEKYIRSQGAKKTKDTSKLSSMNGFIPKFSKMLQYDLSKAKKYKQEFENKQASRDLGEISSFRVKKRTKKYINKLLVNYIDDNIILFKNIIDGDCERPTKFLNISICIKNSSKIIEFSRENKYQIQNLISHIIIEFTIDDEPYEIRVAQGFIENEFLSKNQSLEVKNIDEYFKTIDFSEDQIGLDFYKF